MYPGLAESGVHNLPDLRVSDGDRTRDNRDHNPVLYQLSYTHHGAVGEHTGPAPLPAYGWVSEVEMAIACSEDGPGCGTRMAAR